MNFDGAAAWRSNPGICRCCLSEGCYKDIRSEHSWMGEVEVYADMLKECFNMNLSRGVDGGRCSGICEFCITRLRDASSFKQQVLCSEQAFLGQLKRGDGTEVDVEVLITVKEENDIKCESPTGEEQPAFFFADMDLHNNLEHTDNDSEDLGLPLPEEKPVPKKPHRRTTHKPKLSKRRMRASDVSEVRNVKEEDSRTVKEFRRIDAVKNPRNASLNIKKQEIPKLTIRQKDLMMKSNSAVFIECSTASPFKWSVRIGYRCFYCEKKYTDPETLREHTSAHTVDKAAMVIRKLDRENMIKLDVTSIKCRLCTDAIPDYNSLKSHLSNKHQKKFYKDCGDGVLPFKLSVTKFDCVICSKCFRNFHMLNQHLNTHFNNYICEKCGSAFVSQFRLARHQTTHEKGTYPCKHCEKVLHSAAKRLHHTAVVHNNQLRHRCPHCKELFKDFYQRQLHLIRVHNEKHLQHKCEYCSKLFSRKWHLTEHVRRDHLQERNQICEMCSDAFFTKHELGNHMIKHTGERVHECEICKKTYARKKTLTEHMRIHNNDRRFVCSECGQSFVQNCSLKGHMKTHHPEITLAII